MPEGGEVALKIDYNHETKRAGIEGYAVAAGKGFSKKDVRNADTPTMPLAVLEHNKNLITRRGHRVEWL